jgi:hypothetical protein
LHDDPTRSPGCSEAEPGEYVTIFVDKRWSASPSDFEEHVHHIDFFNELLELREVTRF